MSRKTVTQVVVERHYDELVAEEEFIRGTVGEMTESRTKRATPAAAANEGLRLAVRILFGIDAQHVLTVPDIVKLPEVLAFQEERHIEDETLRRIINAEAPPYAKKRGRPTGSASDDCFTDLPNLWITDGRF